MIFTDMTREELLRAMRKKDIRISATELMRQRPKRKPGLQEKGEGLRQADAGALPRLAGLGN